MNIRQAKLLAAIIDQFIDTAIPVGSHQIIEAGLFPVSGATIRNEMRVLDEEGFIDQPHTSAGRVPTVKGYRMYVQQFMKPLAHERAVRTRFDELREQYFQRKDRERRNMALRLRPQLRGGAKAIELRGVSKAFGENLVLVDARATVMNGERVGIVGANGSGKSVLLKIIMGLTDADEGAVWVGPSIEPGYYSQEHETLDMNQTPIESIRAVRQMYEGEAVSQLGRFLLPYDAVRQPISKLSGGEKSRVQLARLMVTSPNCLVLDEPTNNLDIASCEVLETALDAFSGTIVVVSHDRYFLDRVVDRIFEVRDGELRIFEGGYSYYAESSAPAHAHG